MPRLSVNLNDSVYDEVVRRAEESSVSPSAWAAMTLSQAVRVAGGGNGQGEAPGGVATPSRGPGRPAVKKTAADRRKEEKILRRKASGPKGKLCLGSRKLGDIDPTTNSSWCAFGICSVCGLGSRHGVLQEDGKVLIEDHGDGEQDSNESLDPLPYGSTVPEEEELSEKELAEREGYDWPQT